jgi:1-deoxy-D-xylulose-5-phosphate reductoisomerase
MKSLALLGSTGSIGKNTLNIVGQFPDRFKIKTLTAKRNVKRLAAQINGFQPEMVAVYDEKAAKELQSLLPSSHKIKIMHGTKGYCSAAAWSGVDMTIGAMVGAAGLEPILSAISAGKHIALANKETLVMAGALVTSAVKERSVQLLPVDSEHSAIFQCLQGHRRQDLVKILLTASGGPFVNYPDSDFDRITPEQALEHPNWAMGNKITIDSATLMNKGLEVIEAKWLFDVTVEQIDVIVHPQSIVHSMVAYCDGSMLAQMGVPDMQQAISYALSYPERLSLVQPLPDLSEMGRLNFQDPDLTRFPCLGLAFDACREGGTMPTVLNAANEVAVEAFLLKKIRFTSIPQVIDAAMNMHNLIQEPDLEAILGADAWARQEAHRLVAGQPGIG